MATRPFRVLLYAHVDLNVVDGSAFFVAGAASLLTSAPGIEVDVVTATPLQRAVVVDELLVNPSVQVVDPFRDERLALRRPEFREIRRMDETTAGAMLTHYLDHGHHDVVLVRGSEVAGALAALRPDLGSRLCVYVTGVVAAGRDVEEPLLGTLRRLASGGATLLCQTPEMAQHLARVLDRDTGPASVVVMRPAVPAAPEVVVPLPPAGDPLVVAYTGKFARAWNSVEMLSGFKRAASRTPGMRLLVAGDHFRKEPDWPTFAAEVKYLLGSHPQITWVGGVTREEARDLVCAADVGLGWRSATLDDSLELSTKILENGALGRPTIINPTPMHRRLFGDDYPLFAASMSEFVALLERLARDRSLLVEAAARTADVARDHSYERVFDDLFPALLSAAAAGGPADGGSRPWAGVGDLLSSGERTRLSDGFVTSWLARASDADALRDLVSTHGPAGPPERFGPFIRWRIAGDLPDRGGLPATRSLHLALETVTVPGPLPHREQPAVDRVLLHDRRGRVHLGAPTPDPAPQDGPPGEGAGPAADLSRELEHRAAEVLRLRHQYDALSTSLLGRWQLWYWRLRRRLRGGGARPG